MSIPGVALPDLPIRAVLPAVADALAARGAAVLVAPPGTGKTTVVPLALATDAGRVVVAEPRRVAARAAARRMAELLGEQVGDRVGYTVRGERRVGPRTRIEVVTTGVLVRRLHRDPELAGTAVVILDECHERHLDSDLALAFLVEVRAALRPELRVLATSATAEADRLAEVLGGPADPAPVISADAALFDVEVRWCPPPVPVSPAHGLRVDEKLLDHVASTVRRALADGDGDVLVFLPGAREIQLVANRLGGMSEGREGKQDRHGMSERTERSEGHEGRQDRHGMSERTERSQGRPGSGVEVVSLHGRQTGTAQDAALRPAAGRRIVLATSIAESSLTVVGVRSVVDAGLSRVPRMDHARGLGALVTVPVSRAAAHQRAGRAGREGPGRVYRCWSEAQHDRLPAQPEPAVAAADLTGFALDLARWGHPDGTGLSLPDQPPSGALAAAMGTLRALGATDADGRVTARGRALADAGTHPRLARALLDGAAAVGTRRAAEIVALLSEDRTTGDDLVAQWRRLRAGNDPAWRAEVRRLTTAADRATAGKTTTDRTTAGQAITGKAGQASDDEVARATAGRADELPDDLAAGLVVGLAYPERVARARESGGRAYLMAGGTAADLAAGSGLAGTPWLAVAAADRAPGARTARIRSAAPLDGAAARLAGAALLDTVTEIGWVDGDVVARSAHRLGAITLTERRLTDPDRGRVRAALLEGLRQEGLSLVEFSRAADDLRQRMAFCRQALGEPWPAVDDATLLANADDWLGPELTRARRRADLARVDLVSALRRLLPWAQAARLDEVAPERLTVPSGSRVRVDYADPAAPVLAVKVQETFGWRQAPRLADGRVPVLLHLLSPAGRPVAVTGDLASFWATGYPQVRAELRGRYPRHPWPADPGTAEPTRRTTPRGR